MMRATHWNAQTAVLLLSQNIDSETVPFGGTSCGGRRKFRLGNEVRPRRPRRLDTKTLLNPTKKPALNTPRMSLKITKSHGSVPDGLRDLPLYITFNHRGTQPAPHRLVSQAGLVVVA